MRMFRYGMNTLIWHDDISPRLQTENLPYVLYGSSPIAVHVVNTS